jgi:two-component system, response regulator PdtaR
MGKTVILIVEDEFLIAQSLKFDLIRAGYEVRESVSSGTDAIARAREEIPDVMLMDIGLRGDMDGIEAARRIREFSSVVIIFMTGYQDSDLGDRTMAIHPAGILHKPIRLRDIEALVPRHG